MFHRAGGITLWWVPGVTLMRTWHPPSLWHHVLSVVLKSPREFQMNYPSPPFIKNKPYDTDHRARGDLVSPSFTVGNKDPSFLEQESDLPGSHGNLVTERRLELGFLTLSPAHWSWREVPHSQLAFSGASPPTQGAVHLRDFSLSHRRIASHLSGCSLQVSLFSVSLLRRDRKTLSVERGSKLSLGAGFHPFSWQKEDFTG